MKTVSVVGAAILHDGKVLAARRAPSMPLAGKWEFPGGKVEPGEAPSKALAREIREELGVEVQVGPFLARGVHTAGERRIELDVYVCTLQPGEVPVAREHDMLAWVDARAMDALDWAEADVPAVQALHALIT